MSEEETPQPRLLQVTLSGMGVEGSSESDSGASWGAGARDCAGVAWGRRGVVERSMPPLETGLGGGGTFSVSGLDSGCGMSSTVECLPVVQGRILRNSSNVRHRGLQHFQPVAHPCQHAAAV